MKHSACILELSACILEHAACLWSILHAFWNILHAFWNILHAFWNILYAFWNILEHSGMVQNILELSDTFWNILGHSISGWPQTHTHTHGQTDIRTCWAASSQLKMWKYSDVFVTLLWKSIHESTCIIMHKTSYIIKFQLMIFNSFRYFFTVFFFAPPFKLSWSHRRNTGQRYNERKCINLYGSYSYLTIQYYQGKYHFQETLFKVSVAISCCPRHSWSYSLSPIVTVAVNSYSVTDVNRLNISAVSCHSSNN